MSLWREKTFLAVVALVVVVAAFRGNRNEVEQRKPVALKAAPSEQPQPKIDVSFRIESDGRNPLTVIGSTNLPNGTEVMAELSRPENKFSAETKVVVEDGKFRAGPFSNRGKPLSPGKYVVSLSTPLPGVQPARVRAVIGEKGERLVGTNMRSSDIDGSRVANFSGEITVPGTASASRDKAEAAAAEKKIADERAKAAREIGKLQAEARKALAKDIEEAFLSKGQSVTVATRGRESDVLHFTYVLVSKAFVYQVQHADGFIARCRGVGFKKLVFTDGYDETWTITL